MKIIKRILAGLALVVVFVLALLYFKVLWVLAPYYDLENHIELEVPVMDMEAYKGIWEVHRRPYIYTLQSEKGGGAVCIVGISHTKDPANPSLDSLRYYWKKFNPEVALVEGRVGNLFSWFQNPIEELGEGGLVTQLANKKGIKLYSWESKREKEIAFLMDKFPPEEIAMFYTFRPYFSNIRYGKYENPEMALQDYLESRTDYSGIRGLFNTWQELDEKWQKDFPGIEWREYSSGSGYPEGYLNEIWNHTNILRDENMIRVIVELVGKGKRVFVTMGVSHAPRIEKTLKAAID